MTRSPLPLLLLLAACAAASSEFSVQVGEAREAPGAAGVLLVEWKPAPEPLESAGDRVSAQGGRKVWAVLRDAPRSPKTPPASQEAIRFVSYDAVLNGAAALWYSPALSTAAAGSIVEMRDMAPIFGRGRAIPLPFAPPTDGWAARAWTYHGRDYLVLINRTKDRQWKVPDAALARTWRPLFEARREPRELLKSYKDAYYLKPYQVLVLESRLRPRRLLGR